MTRLWESLNDMCAERLTPRLQRIAIYLARFGVMSLTKEVDSQLQMNNPSTVERLLQKNRARTSRLPRNGPSPGQSADYRGVNGRIARYIEETGLFEVDVVHHGWQSPAGECGHVLQLIDVATGREGASDTLRRGKQAMDASFRQVLDQLLSRWWNCILRMRAEFFNAHRVRFWKGKVTGVQLSCSGLYQKNGNRMVEQKNNTLVRKSLGHLRLETSSAGIAGQRPLPADGGLLYPAPACAASG